MKPPNSISAAPFFWLPRIAEGRHNRRTPRRRITPMKNRRAKRQASKTIAFDHPGVILLKEFFQPMRLTQTFVSKATGIPQSSLSGLLLGRRSITPETAVRLGRFFGVEPKTFLNLQADYDLTLCSSKPTVQSSTGSEDSSPEGRMEKLSRISYIRHKIYCASIAKSTR